MSAYRTLAATPTISPDASSKAARRRSIVALTATIAGHLALLGAGFYFARGEASAAPQTQVVTVLTGRVSTDTTGDFESTGYREARIRVQR